MSQSNKKVNIAEQKADFLYKMISRQTSKSPKSPKSPTIKKKDIKIILSDLPDDLKLEITTYYKTLFKYKLRDWIKNWINEQSNKQSNKFEFHNLSSNSNAIDFFNFTREY